jgi:hypothetical protein
MKKLRGLVFILILLLLGGCAKKYPLTKLEPLNATEKVDFSKYSVLKIEVSKAEGVEITEEDLKRMNELITKTLEEQYKGKFQVVGSDTPNVPNELMLEVKFTKFQKHKEGLLYGTHAEIVADIILKAGAENTIFTGKVGALGEWDIYGGDIPYYEKDILRAAARRWGAVFSFLWAQSETERYFCKKLIKTLHETFPEVF